MYVIRNDTRPGPGPKGEEIDLLGYPMVQGFALFIKFRESAARPPDFLDFFHVNDLAIQIIADILNLRGAYEGAMAAQVLKWSEFLIHIWMTVSSKERSAQLGLVRELNECEVTAEMLSEETEMSLDKARNFLVGAAVLSQDDKDSTRRVLEEIKTST